jgi:hypothetical protein
MKLQKLNQVESTIFEYAIKNGKITSRDSSVFGMTDMDFITTLTNLWGRGYLEASQVSLHATTYCPTLIGTEYFHGSI